MLEIRLFGEIVIRADGERRAAPTSRNARALLAELALKPGFHSRDAIGMRFWPGGTERSARVSLSSELTRIRTALGPAADCLHTTRDQIGLAPTVSVDARQFDEHIREHHWSEAIALWRGDMLQDTSGERADEIRELYRGRMRRALDALAAQAEAGGDLERAVELTRRQFDISHDDLAIWSRLVRRLHAAGDALGARREHDRLLLTCSRRGIIPPREVARALADRPDPAPAAPQRAERPPATPEAHEESIHNALDALEREDSGRTHFGFPDLDELTGGLPEGLTVVAGRPSIGSTTFAITVARNVAVAFGRPVVLFAAEHSEAQLARRLIAIEARVSGDDLRSGRVRSDRWPRVVKATESLASAPLYIDDSFDLSVDSIATKVARLPELPRLIIVDSVQSLIEPPLTAEPANPLEPVLTGLRRLAREFEVPVLVTMGVSATCEARADKRPLLRDLPGYTELSRRPDLALLLYRDEYYNRDTERPAELDVLIADNRHGPRGSAVLGFLSRYPSVTSMYREDQAAAAG